MALPAALISILFSAVKGCGTGSTGARVPRRSRFGSCETAGEQREHRGVWACRWQPNADTRGSFDDTRGNLDQTSFYRKLLAYEATWIQKIHNHDFGIHRFRVLTVTANSERVHGMIEACQKLKQGRGLFLFSDAKTFQEQPDFFSLRWQTARNGETASLLD